MVQILGLDMEIFNAEIVGLIRLYLLGSISEQEWEKLEQWVEADDGNRRFFEDMKSDGRFAEEFPEFCGIDMEKGWKRFERQVQRSRRYSWRRALKYAAAIVIPVALGFSVWFLNRGEQVESPVVSGLIEPGQVKATLVLPGGTTLALKDVKQEEIEVDEGLKAKRTGAGLVYDSTAVAKEEELKYNTLKIPRGGEFRLTLSDGTSVVLNSATNLKFPVTFGKGERKVYLDGEAYFEVKKDSTRPFYVEMEGMQVQVYGTSFNVNTRKGSEVQTVLVEGRIGIKLTDLNHEYMLCPGTLLCFDQENRTVKTKSVDASQYVAWTKGIFTFEEESLEQIMNTLSLWYDVDVFYQTESVKQLHFSGHLGRYKEIQDILDAITEATGVKFSIKGRTIMVAK